MSPVNSNPQTPAQISATAAGVLYASMNLLLVVLLTLLAIASFHQYIGSRSLKAFGVLAVNILFLALFVTRRPAKAETTSLPLWLLGFGGSALPLLLRPAAGAGSAADLGSALQLSGLLLLAVALLSLRRSFAIVPGNRGIRQGGSYRLVRHPVYLAELTVFFGVVLANPTWLNCAVWACECVVQLARARAEERFLSADPLYRAYCERVRYRLIPWVV